MISRRTFIQNSIAGAATVVTLSSFVPSALADPDPSPDDIKKVISLSTDSPEPDIFSWTFGDAEAFVIHDGIIVATDYHPFFAPEASKAQVMKTLEENFLPTDHVSLSINVLVLKDKNGEVSIFDAGAGQMFGSAAGRLEKGLKKIGVTPEKVSTIFVTHAHPDHIAGLVNDKNELRFKNANIIISRLELDFWNSASPDFSKLKVPKEQLQKMLPNIQTLLRVMKPNLKLVEDGVLHSGVEAISTPGHTPGHLAYRISRAQEHLLHLGDAVHMYALQFAHPEWTMIFDCDSAQAINTRKKLFSEYSKNRIALFGYHLPFPGIGHVRVKNNSFEWVPKPWVV